MVVAARRLGDDEVAFRRLCHEIAFTAYAVALADLQLAGRRDGRLGRDERGPSRARAGLAARRGPIRRLTCTDVGTSYMSANAHEVCELPHR